MNSELTPEKLVTHLYHSICIVGYGAQNVSLECNTCNEVLADADTKIPQPTNADVKGA